jgi:hypothetical protein
MFSMLPNGGPGMFNSRSIIKVEEMSPLHWILSAKYWQLSHSKLSGRWHRMIKLDLDISPLMDADWEDCHTLKILNI